MSQLSARLQRFARSISLTHIAAFAVLFLAAAPVHAAPQTEVLATDLAPLIDRAVADPNHFAVDVPHVVGLSTAGEWSLEGGRSVWRYSIQIPTAVSMSFHAAPIFLPPSAQLRVTAGSSQYVYSAKDVSRGQLWSRIARGDTLSLEISVAGADLPRIRFAITSFQAGYRGLGPGVPNHPHYDKLQHTTSGTQAPTPCQENWSCHTDSVNTGAGQGTVALIIGNVGQCTGVLLNDVPGDGTPYVLTARHCENGNSDGGAPTAAANLSVYWDAVVACSVALSTIYDSATGFQAGATTVVEQQDAWLVQLDAPPAVNDAYFAGWDATGGAFIGGFSPHHALGTSRQFVGWSGQAFYSVVPGSALGVGYTSTFWGTVNAVGSTGGGASGAGLFDENGRLTGTVVRGNEQAGGSQAGVCPVSDPPAPSAQSITQSSTALSGIFSSTEDPKSTTGTVTLQSVLDPGHTGTLVMNGQTNPPSISFGNDSSNASTGNIIILEWASARATSCTASGGDAGDGWSGAVATSGSLLVTSVDSGPITYTLTCTNGTKSVVAQVQVNWALSAPASNLYATSIVTTYGVSNQLNWNANVRGCTASGGTPGDGWSGPVNSKGVATVTENTVGTVTYTLSCGSGSSTTSAQATVTIEAPGTGIIADAVTLQPGQIVQITPGGRGLPCATSGGSSTDGWLTDTTLNTPISITESVPGTYTYSITCGSGAYTSTSQVTVVFASAPATVTVTPSSATAGSPLGTVPMSWDANIRPCTLGYTGPQTLSPIAEPPHGSLVVGQGVLGTYVYTLACGTGTDSASGSLTLTVTGTPRLTAFQPPQDPIAGQIFLVQYQGNLSPCTLSGGTPGDGWSGTTSQPNANYNVVEATAGSYTYTITCGTGSQTLSAQTTISVAAAAPMVTVAANPTVAGVNQAVTLTWSSNVSPCQASGGVAGDGWGGAIAVSGSQTVTETATGLDSYRVSCGVYPQTAASFVDVNVLSVGPPSFQANPTSAQAGQAVTLTWSSKDGSACIFSGGSGNDGWAGSGAASGSFQLRETVPGTYNYSVTCGTAPAAYITIQFAAAPPVSAPPPPPSVQLTASSSTVTAGTAVTLSWTAANVDSCTAGGGNSSDGWSGGLINSGGIQVVTETTAGTYNYSITCSSSGQSTNVNSSATVVVNAIPAVTVTASAGGGKSGGGAVDWLELSVISLALAWRRRRIRELRRP